MINKSLAFKLTALVLLFSGLITGSVITSNYYFSRALIVEQAETNTHTRGQEIANQLSALLKPIEQSSRNIGLALEDSILSQQELDVLSRHIVEGNDKLFGLSIAFEPYALSHDQLFYAPYSYRQKDKIINTQLGNATYRYFYMDWYQLPRELGHPVWTEPYFDQGGSESFITTYSVPFYRHKDGKKQFAGVIRADISLVWLQEMISNIKLYETGYATIISRNGTFIYHPMPELQVNETIFSLAERLKDQELWEVGRNMVNGKTGFLQRASVRDQKKSFLLYMPLPIGGWSLAFLFPTDEVLRKVNDLTRNTLIISLLGFLLFSLVILIITRHMIRPIQNLSKASLEIAGGNLHAPLPAISSNDEVGQLSQSFAFMQESLRKFIADLKATTATKERIESELRIAREIQMGILPKIFPPFPNYSEFDIYATLEPAKEVGGDLYDFFFIDENHFCFLIGDVSGKGVPAAFLMAVTKTLLKVVAEQKLSPNEILEKVNNDLAEDNDSCMFVTLFLGILNIQTGEIAYGSAGHNPPVHITKNNAAFLAPINEPIAGAMTGMTYSTKQMTLSPGDILFLYTDGVTEAMNTSQELYSDERLCTFLKQTKHDHVAPLIQSVHNSVTDFSGDAEQSDDITMLALQYTGIKSETKR